MLKKEVRNAIEDLIEASQVAVTHLNGEAAGKLLQPLEKELNQKIVRFLEAAIENGKRILKK